MVMQKSFLVDMAIANIKLPSVAVNLQTQTIHRYTIIGFVQKNKGLYVVLYGVGQTFFCAALCITKLSQCPLF